MNAHAIQNFVIFALVVGAIAYALYKHFGLVKVKAELAQLKTDPKQILADALAAAKGAAPAPQAAASVSAPAPAPAASPAPAAAPAAPPAPVATASVAAGETSEQKVTRLVGELRAKNVGWRDVVMYLQTFGFSRGLTPSEWNAAMAAGLPPEIIQAPTVPPDNSAPFWRPLGDGGFEAAFDHVSGAWCQVQGKGYLHIMVPSAFVGRIWPCANLCPGTVYPVKTTVNHGDLQEAITDGEQQHKMLVFGDTPGPNELAGTPGQWIEMEFDQAPSSSYLGIFYIYPKAAA